MSGNLHTYLGNLRRFLSQMSKPALVVALDGRVLMTNESVDAMQSDDWSIANGRFLIHDLHGMDEFMRILKEVAEDRIEGRRKLKLDRSVGHPLIVDLFNFRFLGIGDAVLLFVVDIDRAEPVNIEWVRQYFGLTQAEARLAGQLMAGRGLDEAAVALAVKKETVRSQAKSLMTKCGVRRQTDFLRLAARIAC